VVRRRESQAAKQASLDELQPEGVGQGVKKSSTASKRTASFLIDPKMQQPQQEQPSTSIETKEEAANSGIDDPVHQELDFNQSPTNSKTQDHHSLTNHDDKFKHYTKKPLNTIQANYSASDPYVPNEVPKHQSMH